MDSFKHVNNAVYLNYLEAARWKFFKDFKMLEDMESQKLYPVVTEIKIRYLRELKLFDKFKVESKYYLENNYIVSEQKIRLCESTEAVTIAKIKMLLVSDLRIVYDVPLTIVNLFESSK